MATKAASKRLAKEAQMMDKDPPPFCYGRPREDNVLEWHFILRGPPDTAFHGGEYWGQLLFPPEYPFKPPGIKVSTPSGRFHVDTKICTSMSDFHPGSWNPAWSVANILVGLLSFMCADEMTTGSVKASDADRSTLAKRSHAFNVQQPRFKRIFPDYCSPEVRALPNMGEKGTKADEKTSDGGTSSSSGTTAASSAAIPSTISSAKVNADSIHTTMNKPPIRSSKLPQGQHPAQQPQTTIVNGAAPRRQAPSRAIFPFVAVLLAYLFIARWSSLSSDGSGSPGSVTS